MAEPLRLYRWPDAPPELQALSDAGGDEECVVVAPPGWLAEDVLDLLPHPLWDLLAGRAPHDEWGYVQRLAQPDGSLVVITSQV